MVDTVNWNEFTPEEQEEPNWDDFTPTNWDDFTPEGPEPQPEASWTSVAKGIAKTPGDVGSTTVGGLLQASGEAGLTEQAAAKAYIERQTALEAGVRPDRSAFKGKSMDESIAEIARQRGEVEPKYAEARQNIVERQQEAKQRTDIGRSMYEDATKRMEEYRPAFGDDDWGKEYIYDLTQAGIRMAPVLGVGMLTRSPALATAAMGPGVFGESYGSRRKEGRSVSDATMDSIASVAFELGTELPVFGQLFKYGKPAVKKILDTTVLEGLSESVSSLLQSAYEAGVVQDEMSFSEAFFTAKTAKDAAYEGLIGFGMGAAMGGASIPGQLRHEKGVIEDIKNSVANMEFGVMSDKAIDGMIDAAESLRKTHGDAELGQYIDVLNAAKAERQQANNAPDSADDITRFNETPISDLPTRDGLLSSVASELEADLAGVSQIASAGSIDEALQSFEAAVVKPFGPAEPTAIDTGYLDRPGYEATSFAPQEVRAMQEDLAYQQLEGAQPQPTPEQIIYDEAQRPTDPGYYAAKASKEAEKLLPQLDQQQAEAEAKRVEQYGKAPANQAMAAALGEAGIEPGWTPPPGPYVKPKPTRGQKMREIDEAKDSLGTMIAKLGGWDKKEALANGIDPADMRAMRSGFLPGFTRPGSTRQGGIKGNTLDGLREYLNGHGFNFEDQNQLLDAINDELRGNKQYTEAGMERQSEQKEIQREQDEARRMKDYEASPDFDPFSKEYRDAKGAAGVTGLFYDERLAGDAPEITEKARAVAKVVGDDAVEALVERLAIQEADTETFIKELDALQGTGARGAVPVEGQEPGAGTGFDLASQTEESLASKEARAKDESIAAKEQADREVDGFGLQSQIDDTPSAPTGDMFGAQDGRAGQTKPVTAEGAEVKRADDAGGMGDVVPVRPGGSEGRGFSGPAGATVESGGEAAPVRGESRGEEQLAPAQPKQEKTPDSTGKLIADESIPTPSVSNKGPFFYLSTGRKGAYYTLRAKGWNDVFGRPGPTDNYMENLGPNREKAVARAIKMVGDVYDSGAEAGGAAPGEIIPDRIMFGKYEGESLYTVAREDPEYIAWLAGNKGVLATKSKAFQAEVAKVAKEGKVGEIFEKRQKEADEAAAREKVREAEKAEVAKQNEWLSDALRDIDRQSEYGSSFALDMARKVEEGYAKEDFTPRQWSAIRKMYAKQVTGRARVNSKKFKDAAAEFDAKTSPATPEPTPSQESQAQPVESDLTGISDSLEIETDGGKITGKSLKTAYAGVRDRLDSLAAMRGCLK